MKLLLLVMCFLFGAAQAQTTSQTLCFVSEKNKKVELVLRTYLDEDLQKLVGGLVKYNTSKDVIPLVYDSNDVSDESLDYELRWLEIYNEKITGEYRLLKPKRATIHGAYVKYKNFKTRRETIFSPTRTAGNECTFR
jgi:hypothetical protein